VVLEKEGEDQLDRSCEEGRSITWSQNERNILHSMKRRKSKWTGNILHSNWLPKDVIEGNIGGIIIVTGRQ
jgi:hypothetical protein